MLAKMLLAKISIENTSFSVGSSPTAGTKLQIPVTSMVTGIFPRAAALCVSLNFSFLEIKFRFKTKKTPKKNRKMLTKMLTKARCFQRAFYHLFTT